VPDLTFRVEGVEAALYAASPLMVFKVRVTNRSDGERVHSANLQCRVELEATRRVYDAGEQERLLDLFDRPERWGRTVRRLLWAEVGVAVPAMTGSVLVDVAVPCSGDLELATTRYLFALRGGDLDVGLSFRGTVFHEQAGRGLQVALVAPDETAHARLPLRTWDEMMDHYFPNSGWLRVRKDLIDRLVRHKHNRGFPTLEQALESLLSTAEGGD
jgi:hypothetical protein